MLVADPDYVLALYPYPYHTHTHWPLTSAGYIAAGEPEVQLQRVIRGGCHRTRQRVDVAAPALRPTHCAIGMRDASIWSVLRHGPHSVHYVLRGI